MSGYGSSTYGAGTYGGAPGAPGAAGGSVARPSIVGEVAWSSYPSGFFIVGASLLDGTDTLGITPYETSFDGPYDQLKVKSFRVSQGKSGPLTQVEAGSSTIDVRDHAGLLNPENPASPLASHLDERLHTVRLRGTYNGVTYGIFYGWVRGIEWQPQGRRGIAQLECVDLFYWLDRAKPVIAATGATTTGAAIGLILDAIDWRDPNLRALSTGDPIPNFQAVGDKTGLQLVADLLTAERGLFYHRGDGVAVYESRLARVSKPSVDTIVDKMRMVRPGLDIDRVKSKATVTRTGGVPQIYEDIEATRRWRTSESDEIETPYLNNDTEALGLAQYLVEANKDPRSNIRSVEITNAEPALLVSQLARQPGDRVTLSESRGGMTGDFHIERRDLSSDGSKFEASWIVSRATTGSLFTIGTSVLDGTDVLVF